LDQVVTDKSIEDLKAIIDVPPQKTNGGSAPNDAPIFSEESLALVFAERHADTLRFVAKRGQWFIWDGTCWREDKTRKAFSLAREVCREISLTCNEPKTRRKIASAQTRAAVVSLAGEDHRLVATIEQWDADPWLLNTPDGIVDLHTGRLREHRREDYMTSRRRRHQPALVRSGRGS
jgi:putative DNA primase/helicase